MPGRQRSNFYHFAAAKQSSTRVVRVGGGAAGYIRRQRVPGEALATSATGAKKRLRELQVQPLARG